MTDLIYFTVSLSGLAALAAVLVVIGRMAGDCPQTAGAARLATWVVVTGFIALGIGAVALIGAALPVLSEGRAAGLYLAIGLLAIALGFGFYNAATMLRDILAAAPRAGEGSAG
ncbi:hypothetical protein LNKW23_22830 [Paralimibaculum aggregatum]|uniref:Uncharacterized protein n=1 Tax=Paralimibaculum aggregatum TaxID=3036245 RepID=A0ABQ6LIF8_9RHOB|nr:hypothetical protein [Limibaculum sp. NKW23]GMG83070.1 hypothetical protein LNKW23_22830 [Limibaculum sp. NKW23]